MQNKAQPEHLTPPAPGSAKWRAMNSRQLDMASPLPKKKGTRIPLTYYAARWCAGMGKAEWLPVIRCTSKRAAEVLAITLDDQDAKPVF